MCVALENFTRFACIMDKSLASYLRITLEHLVMYEELTKSLKETSESCMKESQALILEGEQLLQGMQTISVLKQEAQSMLRLVKASKVGS
jgi:hypothetical protein